MTDEVGDEVSLAWLLELEQLDRDLFRAPSPAYPQRRNVFGGQVASQSLRAAAATVDPAHRPHSFHLYFMRPGRIGEPIVLYVDRLRDGRSFTTRTVVAQQDGEAILTMSASFHREERTGVERHLAMPAVPAPHLIAGAGTDPASRNGGGYAPLDVVSVPVEAEPEGSPGPTRLQYWMRSRHELPDDPVVHACAFAYMTDTQTGSAPMAASGRPWGAFMMTSLDHALHYHRPVRADRWALLSFQSVSIGNGRAMATATVHGEDGTLGATVNQELLMREVTPGAQAAQRGTPERL